MHSCALCIHVPHLDLVDIGQNMSETVRLMATLNPMKKNSNQSTLQPRNPYILGHVPHFHPVKNFFILTLHTLRQSLDWPLISILTSQPMHKMCSSSTKTISHISHFLRKPSVVKFLKRCLLVGRKVLYKFPNDIASKLSHFHAVNWRFMCHPRNVQLLEWP